MSLTLRTLAIALAFFSVGAVAANAQIVQNGSFEDPVVETNQDWDIYVTSELPGWDIEWMPGSGDQYDPQAELHAGVNGWLADDGDQYTELDSDWDGPSGNINGEAASVRLSQEIDTQAGCTYSFSYAFSPRPGTSESNNQLRAIWGDEEWDHTAAGNGQTSWETFTHQVVATGPTTVIAFEDHGDADSLGTFLDDVVVELVECPEPDCGCAGPSFVVNSNSGYVKNVVYSHADTGDNLAEGSYAGRGGNGGNISNGGDDVEDSSTGNGGNGGNSGAGGRVDTGNATSEAYATTYLNTNTVRITRSGTSMVMNQNRGMVRNYVGSHADTGENAAGGSEAGQGGNGGNISNNGGEDVENSSTGNGGHGGSSTRGGFVQTGRVHSVASALSDVNFNHVRIR